MRVIIVVGAVVFTAFVVALTAASLAAVRRSVKQSRDLGWRGKWGVMQPPLKDTLAPWKNEPWAQGLDAEDHDTDSGGASAEQ